MIKHITISAFTALAGTACAAAQDDHSHTGGVLVLNNSAEGATSVSGRALVFSKHLHVASTNSEAISVNGQGRIECSEICIAGGYRVRGGQASIMGSVWENVATDDDPYEHHMAGMDFEAMAADLDDSGGLQLTSGEHELNPGYFSGGMKISGASVRLNPGLYILGGGLSVTAHSNISGEGVTIVILSGDISVAGQAKFNLDAPSDGDLAGLSLVMPSSNNGSVSLSGGSDLSIHGAIYTPEAAMSVTGQASGNAQGPFIGEFVIVDTLTLAGQGVITIGATGNIELAKDPKHD
jgi:hypothetical protein